MNQPCEVCGEDTEDDGYGEPVHRDTGLYGVYLLHGLPTADSADKYAKLTHVAL